MDNERPPGKTTIDASVLLTIARLTALAVEGVNRMGEVPGSIRHLFRRNTDQGVRIGIEGRVVDVDVHVVLEPDTNMRAVAEEIQLEIARAISDMVGMETGEINVHIDDINFDLQGRVSESEDETEDTD